MAVALAPENHQAIINTCTNALVQDGEARQTCVLNVVVVDIQLRVGVSWTSCVEGSRDKAGPEGIVEHV